jgi:RNA polymerase primary sigma factor
LQQDIELGREETARTGPKRPWYGANLRLVIFGVQEIHESWHAVADLIQEGNIGLMKAVEKYDYKRGYKFSTYAPCGFRQAVTLGHCRSGGGLSGNRAYD